MSRNHAVRAGSARKDEGAVGIGVLKKMAVLHGIGVLWRKEGERGREAKERAALEYYEESGVLAKCNSPWRSWRCGYRDENSISGSIWNRRGRITVSSFDLGRRYSGRVNQYRPGLIS